MRRMVAPKSKLRQSTLTQHMAPKPVAADTHDDDDAFVAPAGKRKAAAAAAEGGAASPRAKRARASKASAPAEPPAQVEGPLVDDDAHPTVEGIVAPSTPKRGRATAPADRTPKRKRNADAEEDAPESKKPKAAEGGKQQPPTENAAGATKKNARGKKAAAAKEDAKPAVSADDDDAFVNSMPKDVAPPAAVVAAATSEDTKKKGPAKPRAKGGKASTDGADGAKEEEAKGASGASPAKKPRAPRKAPAKKDAGDAAAGETGAASTATADGAPTADASATNGAAASPKKKARASKKEGGEGAADAEGASTPKKRRGKSAAAGDADEGAGEAAGKKARAKKDATAKTDAPAGEEGASGAPATEGAAEGAKGTPKPKRKPRAKKAPAEGEVTGGAAEGCAKKSRKRKADEPAGEGDEPKPKRIRKKKADGGDGEGEKEPKAAPKRKAKGKGKEAEGEGDAENNTGDGAKKKRATKKKAEPVTVKSLEEAAAAQADSPRYPFGIPMPPISNESPLELSRRLTLAGSIYSASLSPDGGLLAASSTNGFVAIYDTATWELLAELRDEAEEQIDEFYTVEFAPNVRYVAAGGKRKDRSRWSEEDDDNHILPCPVKVFDLETGEVCARLEGHSEEILCIRFLQLSGQPFMLTSSEDGFVMRWPMKDDYSGSTGAPQKMDESMTCMAFAVAPLTGCGNRFVLGACDDTLRLYDVKECKVVQSFDELYSSYCDYVAVVNVVSEPLSAGQWHVVTRGCEVLDAEDNSVASRPNTCTLHRLEIPEKAGAPWKLVTVRKFEHEDYHANSWLTHIACDGRHLAAPTADGCVLLWDVSTGDVVGILRDHNDREVREVILDGHRDRVITCSDDSTIVVYQRKHSEDDVSK